MRLALFSTLRRHILQKAYRAFSSYAPYRATGTHLWDFRSDTVTKPTEGMMKAMMAADVGDDVYGEDPTVNLLERRMAELTGKEAALFCASGTMANQLAIRSALFGPLQSVIGDARSHVFTAEAGGIAYHSRATSIPVHIPQNSSHASSPFTPPAMRHIDVHDIAQHFVTFEDHHDAPTALISLENTLHGSVLPLVHITRIREFTAQRNVHIHLDGARLWNAVVATGTTAAEWCRHVDTVSLCFSKGLGAPIGSILAGPARLVERARHYRKVFGGGWRQAGVLAAAALYAVDNHWLGRMAEDHANARRLAAGLEKHARGRWRLEHPVETNMAFVNFSESPIPLNEIVARLKTRGILVSKWSATTMRLVVHLQTPTEAVDALVEALDKVVAK